MQNKEEWAKLLNEVQNNAPGPNAPQIPDPSTAVSGMNVSRKWKNCRKVLYIDNHSAIIVDICRLEGSF